MQGYFNYIPKILFYYQVVNIQPFHNLKLIEEKKLHSLFLNAVILIYDCKYLFFILYSYDIF